jgi:hypothetical protein
MSGNTVTFPTDLGGSGATYTDDDDTVTGLGNGGYLTRLLPMLSQGVVMARTATNSAAAAVNAPGTSATSTTSLTVGTGSKSFTLAQTGKQFALGQNVVVANTATPTNNMVGTITAFDPNSGAMTISVSTTSGSGTFTAWTVSLSGPGFTGGKLTTPVNDADTVTLVSAATVAIGAASSNSLIISGTTTITAFDSIAAGAEREVTFSGSLTLTHNATSLILPGGQNILTAAGDVARFRSLGGGNWRCTSYLLGGRAPVLSTILAKSGGYTAVQADTGRTIAYTGAGGVTLTLTAPASVSADYKISFRSDCSSGGIVTITPASGAIDGKSSIFAYPGEAFDIQVNGSNYITIGRAKRVLAASADMTGISTANFEAMISDPELVSLEFVVDNITAASGTTAGRAPEGVRRVHHLRLWVKGRQLVQQRLRERWVQPWRHVLRQQPQSADVRPTSPYTAVSMGWRPWRMTVHWVLCRHQGDRTEIEPPERPLDLVGGPNTGKASRRAGVSTAQHHPPGVQFMGGTFSGGTIRCYVRRE